MVQVVQVVVVAAVEVDEYGDDTGDILVRPVAHFRLSVCEQMEAPKKMIRDTSRLGAYEL